MGQRDNRKRVRHRPNRFVRKQQMQQSFQLCSNHQTATSSHPAMANSTRPFPASFPTSFSTTPMAISMRYSYAAPSTYTPSTQMFRPSSPCSSVSSTPHEDALSRDLRIFGGVEDEGSETDLRAQMLDVVLGLFDGLDYDDALCYGLRRNANNHGVGTKFG
jgi:hypothetical protein